ncbi:polysaccharide deacetylase family protein [Terrabacter sp. NPDC000476]|uniref:polysaccharide deacetylase family protein n=1 Tax=Terrabacter sp. NPDC000476 TaxID=3154258 RepID=UPI003327F815
MTDRHHAPHLGRYHARRPRRGALAAGLIGVIWMVAACSSATPGSASSARVSTPAASTSATAATDAVVIPLPPTLAQGQVKGLVAEQDSLNDPEDKRSVATVSVPDAPGLEADLDAIVKQRTAEYEGGRSDGESNELNIGWDPVLAAGDVLGIRVVTRMYTGGAHGREMTQTVYADIKRGTVWTGAQLVQDAGALSRLVAGALDRSDLGQGTPTDEEATRDVRLADDGSLVVVLDQGAVTPESAGLVAVRVSAAAADRVLSSDGRIIRDAARGSAPTIPGSLGATSPTPAASTPASSPSSAVPTTAPATVSPVTGPTQAAGAAVDCASARCIALTFDDGPGPYTQRLLDELAAKDVRATFFLIGRSADNRQGLARAEVEAGHVVGNHTYEHRDLANLDPNTIRLEIDRTAAAIKRATGIRPLLLRPPYGATNSTVKSVARELGYSQILWNVDTEDWKNRNVAVTTERALAGAKRGAIILMHDIHPTTVQAVPGIIDSLRARGYTLVTVPELLAGELRPGGAYFGR